MRELRGRILKGQAARVSELGDASKLFGCQVDRWNIRHGPSTGPQMGPSRSALLTANLFFEHRETLKHQVAKKNGRLSLVDSCQHGNQLALVVVQSNLDHLVPEVCGVVVHRKSFGRALVVEETGRTAKRRAGESGGVLSSFWGSLTVHVGTHLVSSAPTAVSRLNGEAVDGRDVSPLVNGLRRHAGDANDITDGREASGLEYLLGSHRWFHGADSTMVYS